MKNNYVEEMHAQRAEKYKRKNKIKEVLNDLDSICMQLVDESIISLDGIELVQYVLSNMNPLEPEGLIGSWKDNEDWLKI